MVHAQSGSEVQRSSACDNGAWFRSRLLKGLHPKTGACLGERAPVDLFLHRCGSLLAPAGRSGTRPALCLSDAGGEQRPCLLPLCVVLANRLICSTRLRPTYPRAWCQLSSLHGGFRGVSGCMAGRS